MGKQVTPKKREFAKHYAEHGDVTQAALAAGYTGPQGCYRFLRKDENGVLKDEVFRALMIEYGAEGITPLPEPLPLPAKIKHNAKQLGRVLNFSEHRPEVTASGELTVEAVRGAMWDLAIDTSTPAGPRVTALNVLLKDLRDQQIPDPPEDDELVDQIKTKLGIKRQA
jgi:hypothetical protein